MTDLIEQIARALFTELWKGEQYNGVGKDPAPYRIDAGPRSMGGRVENLEQKAHDYATAILPIIQAAIAAETERCARVAEDHCYSIDIGTWAAMTKKEHSAYACDSIAAAIRSKP